MLASTPRSVVAPVPGLVMIAGGKLTTYRVMGRDAVDAASHSLKTTVDLTVRDYAFNDNPSGADFDANLYVDSNDSRFLHHAPGIHDGDAVADLRH